MKYRLYKKFKVTYQATISRSYNRLLHILLYHCLIGIAYWYTFVVNNEDWKVIIGEAFWPVEEQTTRLLRTARSALECFTAWIGPRTQRNTDHFLASLDRQQPRTGSTFDVAGGPGSVAEDQRLGPGSEDIGSQSNALSAADQHLPDTPAGIEQRRAGNEAGLGD